MDALLKSISQHAPELVFILLLVVITLTIMHLRLVGQVRRANDRWKDLLGTQNGETIERLLYDHLKERMTMQEIQRKDQARIAALEARVDTTKRHMGVIKFDAFEDVGGSQSFALAIFDDQGDGAVITSLLGRTDCRVYCKTISRGRTERQLSQEEQRAIEEARAGLPKPILS